MATKKHTFFKYGYNGFFNGSAEKHLFAPFNDAVLETNVNSSGYMRDCLYNACFFTPKAEPNFICGISRGIARLALIELLDDKFVENFGGYGFDDDGNFWADYIECTAVEYNNNIASGVNKNNTATHIIVKIEKGSQKMSVAIVDAYGTCTPFRVQTNGQEKNAHSASALCYALMAYIYWHGKTCTVGSTGGAEATFNSHMDDISEAFRTRKTDLMVQAWRAAENDFYTMMTHPDAVKGKYGSLMIDPDMYDMNAFSLVNLPTIKSASFGEEMFIGNSMWLKANPTVSTAKTTIKVAPTLKTVAEIVKEGKYTIEAKLTEEQRKLIPDMSSYVVNEEIIDICETIKFSQQTPSPCRQVLITGPTGSGKTTAVQMISQCLGLPYYTLPLSAGKDESGLYSTLLPVANTIDVEQYKEITSKFPDASTIVFDPSLAYKMITGVDKEDATEADIIEAEDKIRIDLLDRLNGYKWTESGLVKAWRNGGVCEMLELNAAKPGILKALNEALDDLNHITLPTGEVIKRNPNCFIFATANIGAGYEGINRLSADLIARFQQANFFDIPDDDTMIQRVKHKSNFNDESTIRKMLEVMRGMQKVMIEATGNCATVSPRLVYNWANKTARINDPYKAALTTMVNMISQDTEIREELIHSLIVHFAPKV